MGGGGDNTVEDTPERKELAKISASKYQYFENELMPVRNVWIDDMLSANDASEQQKLDSKVSVGNANVFGKQQQQAAGALNRSGANPSSGAYQRGLSELAEAQGVMGADVRSRAMSTQKDNFVKGLGSVIALGEKKSAEAVDGLNTLAGQAQQSAQDKAMSRAQDNAMVANAAGGLAGFAYSASKQEDGD